MNLAVYDMAGKQVGSYEIDPAELRPPSASSCCTTRWSCTRPMLGRVRRRPRPAARSLARPRSSIVKRVPATPVPAGGGAARGVGGGHIFAKRPRDFGWRMPRKALQVATRMALAARLADDEVKVVDAITLAGPKTAPVARMLAALGVGDTTVLVAPEKYDADFWKSARNIAGCLGRSGGRSQRLGRFSSRGRS